MSVQRIRFRVQDELVILQVQEPAKVNQYSYGDRDGGWRDAKAEDLLEVAAFTRAYAKSEECPSNYQFLGKEVT